MPRKPALNPMILLPNHPSEVVVRIGTTAPWGYYVKGTFDEILALWEAAREVDGVVVLVVASDEGVATAVHHSQIVSILDVRTRTD